ncbi:MAG: sugar transferase [Firmicutes bacterium]|nr:sugar transferase [Bacillota bacterium]
MYERLVKRLIDIILSSLLLLVLSPLLLLIALLVRWNLGGPVLFKQRRPGLNEKLFTIYKFRTMTDERDEEGTLLPNYRRLTRFGRRLRSSSLDELPELFNILKGEMSFIGPRPLLVEYLPLYSERQRLRHTVRPGLSGLAQVSGRNVISWEERFNYDLKYVEQLSFWLDLKIALKTVVKVLRREGIDSGKYVTMEKFKGGGKEPASLELPIERSG